MLISMRRSLGLIACALTFVGGVSAAEADFKPRRVAFQRGMSLVDWGDGGYDKKGVEAQLRKMRSNHVRSVTLIQTWRQDSVSSNVVAPGRSSVPEANLIGAIRSARRLGLSVVLRPYVDVKGGRWRGRILPSNRSRWFASYGNFALHYARIAKRERVSVFVFASEMVALSNADPARWSALAERVRRVFPGPVAYEANWHGEFATAKWFKSLDVLGISAYFPVCTKPTTNVESLKAQWLSSAVGRMRDVSSKLGRPVIFTEIGYRPSRDACLEPWNTSWVRRTNTLAQTSLYDAAFRVWWDVPSWFKGMHWWAISPRGLIKAPSNHSPLQGAWRSINYWYGRLAASE